MSSSNSSKNIMKKIPCGCIAIANIFPGSSHAGFLRILNNGCDFCTEEQRYETIHHLWLTETEKYTWKELLMNGCGWSNHQELIDKCDEKDKENGMNIEADKQEYMERNKSDNMDFLYKRQCGEKIEGQPSNNLNEMD